jgi:hypothetical protein
MLRQRAVTHQSRELSIGGVEPPLLWKKEITAAVIAATPVRMAGSGNGANSLE